MISYSAICYCSLDLFACLWVDANVSRTIYEAVVDLSLGEERNGRRSGVCRNWLRRRHLGCCEESGGSVWLQDLKKAEEYEFAYRSAFWFMSASYFYLQELARELLCCFDP
jgi:hypothetical protein